MPLDAALPAADLNGGGPRRESRFVHASAVAIDGRALLISGPSRSGKSRLASALIAASDPARPIVLIGDDRILLSVVAGRLTARPHPRIAGFIERRGLGIVASPYLDRAPVAALVELGQERPHDASARDMGRRNLPRLAIPDALDPRATGERVLRWWAALPDAT